jgi:hypothetical protein
MSLASLILMTNAVGRNAVSVFARVQSLCVLFMTGVVIMCAALVARIPRGPACAKWLPVDTGLSPTGFQ